MIRHAGASMAEKPVLLAWEVKFPLVTNPHIVKAWGKAMGVTYLFCMLILGPVFLAARELEALLMLAMIFFAVAIGLTLLGFMIMLVIFGNRSHAKFILSDKGISYESVDNRARTLSRMAILAGGLLGSPTAAGAGLLSMSKERISLDWDAVFQARYDERHLTIRLRNQYRDLLHLYCTPEIYEAVRDLVKIRVDQNGERRSPADRRSPLPGALLSTLLVIGACVPLYALVEIAKLHLMVPLLIMVFSLAMVWMMPLFGWVVLPLVIYIPIDVVWELSGAVKVKLVSTYVYRKYELLYAGEWIVIALAVAGLLYLFRISVKSLRGQYVPVLMRDRQAMD